ncbi:MAG TPA: cytochrome b/b6 domain-containing protein [Methylobacter sp.]
MQVWDWPTRVFHWTLAMSFALAFITGESERWRDIHLLLGYTVLGLVAFRMLWGFIGSRYSRFAEFMPHPVAVLRYLVGLIRGDAQHPPGHNPAGAVVIGLLLLLATASGISGWALDWEVGDDWLEQLHETSAYIMLVVVVCHIVGVVVSSILQRENLITAMITGKKRGEADQGIPRSYPLIALLMLAVLVGLWVWAWPERL